jgi:hypothetical protein
MWRAFIPLLAIVIGLLIAFGAYTLGKDVGSTPAPLRDGCDIFEQIAREC